MLRRKFFVAIKKEINSESGAVAVEGCLYFFLFMMLCLVLVDFSTVFLAKSRLERVNGALSSIIRERDALYGKREKITNQEVADLFSLGNVMLQGGKHENNFQLTVSAVYFSGDKTTGKQIESTQKFSSGIINCQAQLPAVNSSAITGLSVLNADTGKWTPVYLITLCVPGGQSLFKRLLSLADITMADLSINNASIPRLDR